MNYFFGTTTLDTVGSLTIPVGFQPIRLRITVGQKYATTQNFAHQSVGVSDGTNQEVNSLFQDTTGGKTVTNDTKIVSHYERVGGSITEVLAASLTSFNTTGLTLNVTVANVNYNVLVEVWG